MTESMIIWCIDELRYKSKEFQETGAVTAYDGDIVKSDVVVPPSLQHALKASAAPLEDVPEMYRDWHPGSDNTVLDLVHPSLFPVVYGRTKILRDSLVNIDDCVERCGEGEILGVPPSEETKLILPDQSWRLLFNPIRNPYSRKFQWLPCEVEFDGDKVKLVPLFSRPCTLLA